MNSHKNYTSTVENIFEQIENDYQVKFVLDQPISQLEIQTAITTLKNGKAPGLDRITNEMIKAGRNSLIKQIQTLFNLILASGQFPSTWNLGVIVPIYKKGDKNDPGKYRGITLLSTVSKLFTSILKQRLIKHINKLIL